ncbi:hypothetical protein [Anabaena sp. CCY 0017]|uniref:hypothetical protein n=1 Tax=Anabaena sp. CCY 0017 TaxID=3103866 RepID=UPI0039C74B7C
MNPNKKATLLFPLPHLVCFSLLMIIFLFISTKPANANSIEGFFGQFEQIYKSLQHSIKWHTDSFAKTWGKLGGEIKKGIESTIGDLGIPDPLEAGDKISKILEKQEYELLKPNPRSQGQDAKHEWNRQYTLGQSQSTLGAAGQKVQAQEAELTNNALATSIAIGDAAQEDIITQDILKKIAVQNIQGVIISKSIQSEAQKQSRALAAANINLTDISTRMDEKSRKEEAEARATASQILEAAAFRDGFWSK